ncbi:MAG: hypothetical protein NTY69_02735 [Methylococcales bacterium]|nr:hypothetical protein [Methylococcales bacterium]
MRSKILLIAIIFLAINIIGCALSKAQYTDNYNNIGDAVRNSVQSQIANPNASTIPSSSYSNGMEGYSANQVLNGYRSSFTKPSGVTENSSTSSNLNNLSGNSSSTGGQ